MASSAPHHALIPAVPSTRRVAQGFSSGTLISNVGLGSIRAPHSFLYRAGIVAFGRRRDRFESKIRGAIDWGASGTTPSGLRERIQKQEDGKTSVQERAPARTRT